MIAYGSLGEQDLWDLFDWQKNAAAVRALREWCDRTEALVEKANVRCCDRCATRAETRAELVEEVRALLPPLPEVAGEVSSGRHEGDFPR